MVMSDGTSVDNGTAAAADALSSAAEQVRTSATGAYDAAKSAAGYVGETASEYPISVLLGATVVAFLAGYLTNTRSGPRESDWQKRSRDWQRRAYQMSDRVRSAAPSASEAASEARQYVRRNVQEHPFSGLLSAAAVVGLLGYFLQSRR
jgi:ElaB/YqjD/DUF883 family membrane-anchored ribosome-binding protein